LGHEECSRPRRGRIDHIDIADAAVAVILLGEVERGAVDVGHEFVGGQSLPVCEHCQLRVLLAAGGAQIAHQFGVEAL
jgi:hypothetical protein